MIKPFSCFYISAYLLFIYLSILYLSIYLFIWKSYLKIILYFANIEYNNIKTIFKIKVVEHFYGLPKIHFTVHACKWVIKLVLVFKSWNRRALTYGPVAACASVMIKLFKTICKSHNQALRQSGMEVNVKWNM